MFSACAIIRIVPDSILYESSRTRMTKGDNNRVNVFTTCVQADPAGTSAVGEK